MGFRIESEVYAYVDRSLLKDASRALLLYLAHMASDSDRLTWVSVDRMVRCTHYHARSVTKSLAELTAHGYLEVVPDTEVSTESLKYPSTVRRIRPSIDWPFTGEDMNKREHARQQAAEAEFDPTNLLDDPVEIPQPRKTGVPVRASNLTESTPDPAADAEKFWKRLDGEPGKPRVSWQHSLVSEFRDMLSEVGVGPTPVNFGAMMKYLSSWVKEDEKVTPEVIRLMMREYCAPYYQRSRTKASWIDFVDNRFGLLDAALEAKVEESSELPPPDAQEEWLSDEDYAAYLKAYGALRDRVCPTTPW